MKMLDVASGLGSDWAFGGGGYPDTPSAPHTLDWYNAHWNELTSEQTSTAFLLRNSGSVGDPVDPAMNAHVVTIPGSTGTWDWLTTGTEGVTGFLGKVVTGGEHVLAPVLAPVGAVLGALATTAEMLPMLMVLMVMQSSGGGRKSNGMGILPLLLLFKGGKL